RTSLAQDEPSRLVEGLHLLTCFIPRSLHDCLEVRTGFRIFTNDYSQRISESECTLLPLSPATGLVRALLRRRSGSSKPPASRYNGNWLLPALLPSRPSRIRSRSRPSNRFKRIKLR